MRCIHTLKSCKHVTLLYIHYMFFMTSWIRKMKKVRSGKVSISTEKMSTFQTYAACQNKYIIVWCVGLKLCIVSFLVIILIELFMLCI